MADLEVEAPLAEIETDDDFGDFEESTTTSTSDINPKNCVSVGDEDENTTMKDGNANNFGDISHKSLEDLVGTFDEKISSCFNNFEENVEKIAPVQIRSQEEIIAESQTWWTITGNFGTAPPIDWNKSYTRRLHLPTLNISTNKTSEVSDLLADNDDDLQLASDLDVHALISRDPADLTGTCELDDPSDTCQSADEVIREIHDMMADTDDEDSCADLDSPDSAICEIRHRPPLVTESRLETMTLSEINDITYELELIVQEYSEVLIDELARRDELEYEKELKNQFISMLLSVQNQRRQNCSAAKKRNSSSLRGPKYLTTVIPFCAGDKCPPSSVLQMLIKLLRAIDEDSPTVPTLLTDYILKVLCPS